MKIAIQDIFLKLMFNISKYYLKFKMIYPIFPEKIKIEKVEKLVVNFHDKMEYVSNTGFLTFMFNIPMNCMKFIMIYIFWLQE